jgi:hypothetical protein
LRRKTKTVRRGTQESIPSVNAEDLVINHNGEGQEVKQVGEVLPNVRGSIILQTLVVEAVNLSDLTGLVVAS